MDPEWNDSQPIYRQLRDRVVAMILDGVLKEGDPLPSVRNVAAEYRVNPLTVLKAYQQLVDEGLVEKRRGLGMFINDRRARAAARRRAPEVPRRAVAADPRHHPAARPRPRELLSAATPDERSAEPMACIEARGLRKTYGTTIALDGIDLDGRRGPHPRPDRPQRRRQDHGAQRHPRPHPYEGELKVLGPRPLERARRS